MASVFRAGKKWNQLKRESVQPYRSKQWRDFRSRVILLDNGRCVQCGRSDDDGIALHVHHKEYQPGKLPWEYPLSACEALCAGCHAAHHGLIPPKVGWEFAGYDDLGDLSGTCDLCGTDIRHVFLVHHSDWPAMEVGEVCCDNLTDREIASNHMESVRRFNDRKKRFVESPRWNRFSQGEYIQQGPITIEVRALPTGLQLRMNGAKGKQIFDDVLRAKAHAFDIVESQEHSEFVDKLRRRRLPLAVLLRSP